MTCLVCIADVMILVKNDVPLLISLRNVRNDTKTGIRLSDFPKESIYFPEAVDVLDSTGHMVSATTKSIL